MLIDCDRNELRQLLHHEDGLSCLPSFAKDALLKNAEKLIAEESEESPAMPESDTHDYVIAAATPLYERLQFLHRHIEPLTNDTGKCFCEAFATICRKSLDASDARGWQRMLGLRASPFPNDRRDFERDLWVWTCDRSQPPEVRLASGSILWTAQGCYGFSRDGVRVIPSPGDASVQMLIEVAGALGERQVDARQNAA